MRSDAGRMTGRVLWIVGALSLATWAGLSCGGDSASTGPCSGVTCSSHGVCAVQADGLTAYCQCAVGYHPVGVGLDCAANDVTDPCTGVTCSSHGTCRVDGGNPTCDCSSGFEPDPSGLLCLPAAMPDADAEVEADAEPEVAEDVGADADGDEDVGADADVPDEADAESSADADVEDDSGAEADADAGCTAHTDCDDGLSCTLDTCNFATHACAHAARDAECDDGLVCNGSEVCDPATGAAGTGCVAGTPIACDDSDDCTSDSCDESTNSCVFEPRDGDGDTAPDATCGGTDCDDTDPNVFPGQIESCNLADDDCDTLADEDLWEAGTPVRVSTTVHSASLAPSLAIDPSTGNAAVVWATDAAGAYARIVSPERVLLTPEIQAVAYPSGWPAVGSYPSVSAADGGFLVACDSYSTLDSTYGVAARTMTTAGALGTTVDVVTGRGIIGQRPWLVRTAGYVVVLWYEYSSGAPVIRARRLAADTLAPLSPVVDLGPGLISSRHRPIVDGTRVAFVREPAFAEPSPRALKVYAEMLTPVFSQDLVGYATYGVPYEEHFAGLGLSSSGNWVAWMEGWYHSAAMNRLFAHEFEPDGTVASGSPRMAFEELSEFGWHLVAPGPTGESIWLSVSTQVRRRTEEGAAIGTPLAFNRFAAPPGSAPHEQKWALPQYEDGRYWFAWLDARDGTLEVYVNNMRCAY